MKKRLVLLPILLMAGLILTGCEAALRLEAIYSDDDRKEKIIALIKADKSEEAFDQVQNILLNERYSSIELNEIAYNFIEENEPEEGLYILHVIQEKYPKQDSFRNNLSWGYNSLGKYKLADYYSDLALEVEPNEAIEYVNKGNALLGLDKNEAAIDAFKTGYALDNKEKYCVWGLAKTYYEMEKYEEALKHFKEYNTLAPEEASETSANICNSLIKLSRYEEAIAEYEQQFASDPTDSSPLYRIAEVYQDQLKNNEKALEYCHKITDIDKDAWAYLNLADYLAKNNRKEEACDTLKKAVALDAEVLYELSYYESFEKLKGMGSFKRLFN